MKRGLYLILLAFFAIGACKKEQPFSRFSTNLLLPLAHTELDLGNLVSDSMLVPDANGALRLVSSADLYRAKIDDLFVFPDSERVNTLSLKTLKLADQTLTQAVPLFLIFPAASVLHGQTVPIPAQSISGAGSIPIDASSFFKEAVMNSGTMEISITNGYPVEISTLIFQLSNVVDGSIIQTDTFTNILPNSTQTKVIDLAGKKLYSQMEATPILIETAASSGAVTVNQYAITTINFSVKDLQPQSAIARFPAQTVLSSEETIVYNFGQAQLKRTVIRGGKVSFRVVSTIEEEMKVVYQIPYSTLNGVPFNKTFTVPAAPPGGSSEKIVEYDIANYDIDLRGKDPTIKDTVNSFYNILDVSIDSSGIERNISLDDSVFIYVGLIDLEPEYAEGYFGNEVFEAGPETVDFEFFKELQGGIDFEDININLVLENGLGMEGRVDLKQLTARNTKKGTTVALTGAGVSGPHILTPATYPPLTPTQNVINLNSSNSNIKPFVELLPDKLDYHFSIVTSPNGNVNNYRDFVANESELAIRMEVDMPVSLKADALTMSDTFAFNLEGTKNQENILEGKLNIVADNGFPFEIELQLFLLDDNGNVLDSLVGQTQNRILAGDADVNNRITQVKRSVIVADIPNDKMGTLRNTRKVMVRAKLDTPKTNANYWKIYTDYTLKICLTGDFIYDQNY